MKKLAILGASAVLAALPVVGVFADATTEVTDNLTITVDSACTLGEDLSGKEVTKTIASGASDENLEGSSFTVTCNDKGGWEIKAKSTDGNLTSGADTIGTGTTMSGATSAWNMKVEAGAGASAANSFDNAHVVPTGDGLVIANSSKTPTAAATVKVTYGVFVSATQAPGTYTGSVVYTLSHPDSAE